jgi:thiamine biosynthesis lipoprotein ApbE
LKDASLSTSGDAERPGHIASPFTGRRIMETYSASVIAPSAAEADAWSTALFVRGPGAASSSGYDGCFVFSDARPVQAPACSRYLGQN